MRKFYCFAMLLAALVLMPFCALQAQSFNPSQLPNLALWLRADTLVTLNGSTVSQWGDLSGNGYNAAQGIVSSQPLAVNNVKLINHKPTIQFDGSNDSLTGPLPAGTENSSLTVFIIAKSNSTTNAQGIFFKLNTGVSGYWLNESGGTPQYLQGRNNGYIYNCTPSGLLPGGYPYKIIEAVKELGVKDLVYLNETQVRSSTTAAEVAAFPAGTNYSVGSKFNTPFKGEIAEIIIYKAALDSASRKNVEGYLFAKYAPPVNLGPDIVVTTGFCPVKITGGDRFVSQVWSTGQTGDTISVSANGTYWVTATDVFGRVSRDTIVVTFPNNKLNHANGLICMDDSIPLSTLLPNPNNYTYVWQNGATGDTLYASTAGNYYVAVTDQGGCTKNSDTITLGIDNFKQTVSLGADTTMCAGSQLGLTSPAIGWGSLTFNWSTGSTNSLTAVSTPGNYTVTVTNALGCTGTDVVNVSINGTAPQINFVGDTLCFGELYYPQNTSIPLDASTINYYHWDFGNGDTSLIANPVYNYNSFGVYNVTLLARTTTGCSNSATHVVQVKSAPVADFAPAIACAQNAYQFIDQSTAPQGGTIAQYAWSFGDGGSSSLQNPQYTYTATGSYTVQLIVNGSTGCNDTATQAVQVVSTYPAASAVQLNLPVANAQTAYTNVSFSWFAASGAVSYQFEISQDSNFVVGVTTVNTLSTQTTQSLANGTWYWRVKDYNICNNVTVSTRRTLLIFNPSVLGNLALWLGADSAVQLAGGLVTQWNDRSGNNYHASQAVFGSQPTYVPDVRLINHKPTIQFDGTTDSLSGPFPAGTESSSLSVFIIAKSNATTNSQGIFVKLNSGLSGYWLNESGGTTQFLQGRNNGSIYNTTGVLNFGYPYKIIEAVKNLNTRDILYLNEVQVRNVTTLAAETGPFPAGTNYSLGSKFNFPFKGEMAEIIIYKSALDSVNRRKVENYLYEKYAPPVNLGPDITVNYGFCPIKLTGGDRFVSQVWNTGQTTDTISVSTNGTYWVTATDVFGRVSRDTITVNFPNSHLNHGNSVVCLGQSLTLTPQLPSLNNYTYLWQNGATTSSINATTNGNYYVAITDQGGCVVHSDTISVTLDSFQTSVSLGPDTIICSGSQLGLASPTTGWNNLTFSWSTGAATPTTTINTGGVYTVTVTNALGCTGSDVTNVNLQGTAPQIGFSGDTLCLGELYNPQNTSASLDTSSINYYRWNFGNGDTSNVANPMYLYNQAGVYNVDLVIRTTAGCSNSTARVVDVRNVPQAVFAPATACAQNAYQFSNQSTAPSGGSITQYSWSFGDGGTSALQNPQYTYTATGTYTVELIVNSSTGCADTATQAVQVVSTFASAAPVQLSSPANNSQTAYAAVTFTWQPANGAVSYQFELSQDSTFVSGVTSVNTTGTQSAQTLTGGSWYWRVKDFNICGNATVSTRWTVSVFNPGSLSNLALWLAADSLVGINGSTVSQWSDLSGNNFHATQGVAASQPTWLNSVKLINHKPTIKFDGTNDSLAGPFISGSDNSSLSVFMIVKSNAVSNAQGIFVKLNSSAGGYWLNESGGTTQYLQGRNNGSIYNTTGVINAGYPYKIIEAVKDLNARDILYLNETQVRNVTTSTAETGPFPAGTNYSIGSKFNFPFNGEIAEMIIYKSALDSVNRRKVENYLYEKYAPPVNLGPDITVNYGFCPVMLTGGDRFVSQVWSTGQTTDTISVSANGTYWVTATDVFGRVSRDTIKVTFPNTHLNQGNSTVCLGSTIALYPQLPSLANYTYTWQDGSTASTYNAGLVGNYYVAITDQGGCTAQSDTISIAVDSFSLSVSLGPDSVMCQGSQLGLSSPATGWNNLGFNWSTGATTPTTAVTAAGNYNVTVTNTLGCSGTDAINVTLNGVAPLVDFTGDTLCLGETYIPQNNSVSLDASTINYYRWYFDNGDSSTIANPVYTYSQYGVYNVALVVKTTSGCGNSATRTVQVKSVPVANFANAVACIQNAFQFTDQSMAPAGGSISQWSWDFGDLGTAAIQNPQHTYAATGNYNVQLIADGSTGCSDTIVKVVQVVSTYQAADPVQLATPLNGAQTTQASVTFQWSQASGAISYQFQLSQDATFNSGVINVNTTATQTTQLITNGTWYWRVNDFNICGNQTTGQAWTITLFNPASLPNLTLWLAADTATQLGSVGVSQWGDISGNGYHAQQITSASQPLLIPDVALLNHKPVLRFDGSNDSLYGIYPNGVGSSSLSVFMIVKGNSVISAQGIFLKLNTDNSGFQLKESGSTPQYLQIKNNGSVQNTQGLLPAGYPYTIVEAIKELNVKVLPYMNGQQVSAQPLTLVSSPFPAGSNYSLGSKFNSPFNGDMAEVLIYKTALDTTNRRLVENYLYNKYAPPVNLGPDIHEAYKLCPIVLDAGDRFTSYLWSTGEVGSSIEVRASGTYSVTVSDVFGRISSDEINVTIPFQGMNTGDTTFCAGGSATIFANMASMPYSYKWYFNDTTTVLSTATSITPTLAGDYFALIADTNGCRFVSDTVTITIDSFAYWSLLPHDTTICGGNDLVIDTGNYIPQSITWITGVHTPAVTIVASGDYWVNVTDINGCISKDTSTVTKGWNAPVTDFSASDVCLGQNVNFADASVPSSPDAINSWSWTTGDGNTSSQQAFSYNYSIPGDYLVTMFVVTDSGCTGFKQKFVKVSSFPNAAFAYPGVICAGTTAAFTDISNVASGDSIAAWTWIFNNVDTFHTQTTTYAFPTQGNIPVTLIAATSVGCADTVNQTLEVFANFSADFASSNVCLGDSTAFIDLTQSLSIVAWQWTFGDNSQYSYKQNPKHKYGTAGAYYVTLTAENAIGCVDTTSKLINIVSKPIAGFSPLVGCEDSYYTPIDNTVSPNEPVAYWNWNINGSVYGVQAPQHYFADTGSYAVSLKVTTQSGCVDSVVKTVAVKPLPSVDFSFDPLYGEAPATINFTNLSTNAVSYVWNFGEGDPVSDVNPSYTYQNNDTFTIMLVGTSAYGCVDSASRVFIVAPTSLDVAITNAEATQLTLPDGSVQITVKGTIANVGTRLITDVKLYATVGSGGVIEETWTGLLPSGMQMEYTFTAKFIVSDQNADSYVCVEAKAVNGGETEVSVENNKQCTSLNGVIQLVGPSPNPSSDHSTLGIILPKAGTVYIALVDVAGHYVMNETSYNLPQGRTDYAMPIEMLRAAEYYVRVRYNDDKIVRKFVVRK
ncbi:MAG: PKD domain-containing protein [Chitinophagales bacterium]